MSQLRVFLGDSHIFRLRPLSTGPIKYGFLSLFLGVGAMKRHYGHGNPKFLRSNFGERGFLCLFAETQQFLGADFLKNWFHRFANTSPGDYKIVECLFSIVCSFAV